MDQFPARFRPCAIQHAGEQQPRQVHKRGDVQLDHGHVGRQVTFRGESAFTNFVRRMTPMRRPGTSRTNQIRAPDPVEVRNGASLRCTR